VSASPLAARRISARVEGVVQGVGFRPFVFRLAEELALAGFVRNDTRGVIAEVEGEPGAVERFLAELAERAPPLARVERVTVREMDPEGARGFAIAHSDAGGAPDALVSADSATCADCLAELRDPADRRYRYPFVNCTNCGPRFTIVRGVPYDRPLTTMAGFAMCPACQAEYDDPRDRRFHAQPNACPTCGPRARLLVGGGGDDAVDAVAGAAALLRDGAIVAIKGLGGYHLACRADHEEAVAALRSRKHREDRPFALMARDLARARQLVELAAAHEALLTSPARPIVLAARHAGAPVAGAVAPGLGELGVMLPYSPLHHLLLADAGYALVMTSGNVSDEPIAFRDEDALERLAPIADAFLVHDRPIHTRTDDSVARVAGGRPLVLRRSRGLVPEALALPVAAARPVLACGAELKSTFCLAKGARAWLGHHIGDLRNAETLASFTEGIAHFEALFAVAPEVVAHDLHPEYLSTAYALEREGVRLLGVQHHHAHLAACLAEHGQAGPAVGAIYDGTGHGTDGTAWGGELLVGDLRGFERAGHLVAVRLPGGDRAVRQPWRMACAWLVAACGPEPELPRTLAAVIPPERWDAVARMAETGFAAPLTTSMGRLFDAVAALCGLRTTVSYEGQAAIELEALADAAEPGAYALPLEDGPEGAFVLDARVTIREVLGDLERGATPAVVSARFHRAVAGATARACARAAEAAGTDRAVLSGGVFQNRLLLEQTAAELRASGLSVLTPERVPPNDGGIAYGQAAIAAASG
jgi:hydrogenase maturation protein HypF